MRTTCSPASLQTSNEAIAELRTQLALEHRLARTDSLTGLLNGRGFFEADEGRRRKRSLSLPLTTVFIDLDNLKLVNDTLGHETGSHALEIIGQIIAEQFRPRDLASRLGGDEFAIAVGGVSAEEMDQRLHKLRLLLDNEMRERRWPITFSIGAATFSEPTSLRVALREADRLMYEVKRGGKNGVKHRVQPWDRSKQTDANSEKKRMRALVADDDPKLLAVVASCLEEAGLAVISTRSGAELIGQVAHGGPFDVVVTDISLPWMSGLEAMRTARRLGMEMPIVVMTALKTESIPADVERLGGKSFLLRKPFNRADLQAAVSVALA